jgi:hypothetical protein
MSPVKLIMPLFVAGHGDGALGTDEGADAAAFAEIIVDFYVAGLLVSGDAKIRTKISAQVAAPAEIVPKAPARFHDRCLLIEAWFDLVKVLGVPILVPAPDFQFTWFSHFVFQNQEIYRRDHNARRAKEEYPSALSAHKIPLPSPFTKGEALGASFLPLFRKEGRGEICLVPPDAVFSCSQGALPPSGHERLW